MRTLLDLAHLMWIAIVLILGVAFGVYTALVDHTLDRLFHLAAPRKKRTAR